jgi:hypothetical protein
MYPKTSLLEKKIWDFLNSQNSLVSICEIKDNHPNVKTEVKLNKGLVVISTVGNPDIGRYITTNVSNPLFRFTGYSHKRVLVRQIQEALIDIWEGWDNSDSFSMEGQKIQVIKAEGVTEPTLEKSIELYYASVLYQFKLALY